MKFIYAFFLLILMTLCPKVWAQEFDTFFSKNEGLPIGELKVKGNKCLERNRPDSAMMYYQMVTGRYRDNMSKEEKEVVAGTYSNCGYVYTFYYNDFSQAYLNYQRAEEISVQNTFLSILPYVYLNKGAIYANFNDSTKVLQLYRNAFFLAIEHKDWDVTLTAFTNMVQLLDFNSQTDIAIEILDAFSKLNIPDMQLLKFARLVEKAGRCAIAKDWDGAIVLIEEAKQNIDIEIQPVRYEIACNQMIAQLYFRKGDYEKALEYFNYVLLEAHRQEAYDCMNDGLAGLSRVYKAIGNPDLSMRFRLKQADLRDSLFSSRSYALICDMQSSYELSKISSRVKQLEAEKRMQMIIITIGGVSLLVFLIMLYIIIRKNRRLNEQNLALYLKNEELNAVEVVVHSTNVSTGPLKTDDQKRELLEKIDAVMNDVDMITRPDFSLAILAELTDSKERYVSQVINEECKKNFNTWLGECRVKEACRRIKDKDRYANLTIEGIAQSIGFKSRSNFTTVFKKVTGLTPSEYQKIADARE